MGVIETSGYATRVLELAATGLRPDDIAQKISDWDIGFLDRKFTGGHVGGYLKRALAGGRQDAIDIQRARDASQIRARFNEQLELARTRSQSAWPANSPVPVDANLYRVTMEHLLKWSEHVAKLEQLMPTGTTVNVMFTSLQLEADTLKEVIFDLFKDEPEKWARVKAEFQSKLDQKRSSIVEADYSVGGPDVEASAPDPA